MPHLPAKLSSHSHLDRVIAGIGRGAPFASTGDACCAPARAISPPELVARRAKLSDLDPNLHCSIIGTCLTTAELRRLVPRHAAHLDRQRATDLDIHHTAVELSTDGGAAAKELNKALDTRHAAAIKRHKTAAGEPALRALWQEALSGGDVPGAYWALMTHPDASFDLRRLAFGDVHMLSHLVGASNRADIRRLALLEEENVELKEQDGRQQSRLHDMGVQHDVVVRKLEARVAQLTGQRERQAVAQPPAAADDWERKLALHTARRDEAEKQLQARDEEMRALRAELQLAREAADIALGETRALEQAWSRSLLPEAGQGALPPLDGLCIAYVGGRPGSSTVLGQLVAAAGGELLVHDGGIEDRRGLLSPMLSRARMVVFPVDCISHNAMHVTKQTCARLGIACHPLRTASVASFVELMQRVA